MLTGDFGYRRGRELFWTGRATERINLQGRKLDPSELERVLLGIPGLRKGCFAAFGRARATLGTEVLVLLTELEPETAATPTELSALAARIRRELTLALGISPEEIGLVAKGTLTKTSSGKRRHRHFAARYAAGEVPLLHLGAAGLGG